MSCFPLSATCHGSQRDAEAALEYLDFLDENEPLDGAGVISDDDGSAISLPSDVFNMIVDVRDFNGILTFFRGTYSLTCNWTREPKLDSQATSPRSSLLCTRNLFM